VKTPRDYQSLRAEHAKATKQPASQNDQAQVPRPPEADNSQSVPEPTRPTQVRAPGWNGTGDLVSEQTAANRLDKWVNKSVMERQSAQPDVSVGIAEKAQQRDKAEEKLSGKELHAADLQAAKQAGRAARPQQGADRNVSPQAAAKQEKLSGKALHAADLKAAKESAKEPDQSRDTSRSR